MSEFIERSKHPDMTAAVSDHFGMGPKPKGYNNSVPLPTRSGAEQDADKGLGLNYMPHSQAGHKV